MSVIAISGMDGPLFAHFVTWNCITVKFRQFEVDLNLFLKLAAALFIY